MTAYRYKNLKEQIRRRTKQLRIYLEGLVVVVF